MQVRRLDHVNIQTTRLPEMVRWYKDVLGLQTGPRPEFSFPGVWLYAGETAVIHLVGSDGEEAVGSEAPLKLEHFAFAAEGRQCFEDGLRKIGETHRQVILTDIGLRQFHLRDPDGNHVHIDFLEQK